MADIDYTQFTDKMKKTSEVLGTQFDSVRAGRANAAVLDQIRVDYYGTPTPINQIASIATPDPRSLAITPYDGSALKHIEKAIQESDLGINPQNDGKVIRLVFPQLTEERRKELIKLVKKYAEEAKIAIRNIRRDVNETLKKSKKDKEISEDDMFRLQEEAQKTTDGFIGQIDEILRGKEKEVMEV